MRKNFILFLSLIAACSCAAIQEKDEKEKKEISLKVELAVSKSQKTSYSEDSGKLKCTWNKGDCISVVSLKDGKITTVDRFTASDGGSSVSNFIGTYSGKADADIVCIYPAICNSKDSFIYSDAVAGNECGYFRFAYGASYLSFAPVKDMIFKQESNADTKHISALDLMSGKGKISDGTISLQKQISLLRCVLNIPDSETGEKFSKLVLSLDNGTPFTDYMATLGLASPADAWAVESGKKSFTMTLGDFTASEKKLTVYVPAVPNLLDNSLGGTEQRTLTVTVTGDKDGYQGTKVIPANSRDTLKLSKGKINEISVTLSKGVTPPPTPPEEIFGQSKKFLDESGYAMCIDGNYLYCGCSGSVYVYDVSTPFNPVLKSTINFQGQARQMCVYNNKLFVTAREAGTWIFDVSDPLHPTTVKRVDCVELATGLDVAGNVLFVGQRQNGVEYFDITNPAKPEHIRVIKTDESQSVFYANGYLYSGEWSTGSITIFDAHDMSDLKVKGKMLLQGYGDGIWVSGNRLYASTGHHHKNAAKKTVDGDGHGMEIWDITNPESPSFISRTEFDIFYKSGTDYWMPRPAGDGRTVFCSDVYNGLYLVDVTDETKPSIIKRYQSPSKMAQTGLALGDGVLYVCASSDGFIAIECPRAVRATRNRGTLPVNPSARYDYGSSTSGKFHNWKPTARGAVHAAIPYGDALYVACGDAGLAIIKKDGSGNPVLHGTGESEFAGGVAVLGDKLYVAEGDKGFGVYKIKSDYSLTLVKREKSAISSRTDTQLAIWISVPNDNYVAVGSRYRGYQYLAIGGTEDIPTYTNKLQNSVNVNYNKYIAEKVCNSNLLPYATRTGFVWINLSSTAKATAGTTNTDITVSMQDGVTNFKDGTALFTKDKALRIIEAGATTIKSSSSTNDSFIGIPRWDGGNRILIANNMNYFTSIVNVSNFSSPTVEHHEVTGGKPEAGCFWNGKAVVPCGYQGLLIEK